MYKAEASNKHDTDDTEANDRIKDAKNILELQTGKEKNTIKIVNSTIPLESFSDEWLTYVPKVGMGSEA